MSPYALELTCPLHVRVCVPAATTARTTSARAATSARPCNTRFQCTPSRKKRVSFAAFTPQFVHKVGQAIRTRCLTTFGRLSRFQATDLTRQSRTVSDVCTSTCIASLSLCNPNSRFSCVRLFLSRQVPHEEIRSHGISSLLWTHSSLLWAKRID